MPTNSSLLTALILSSLSLLKPAPSFAAALQGPRGALQSPPALGPAVSSESSALLDQTNLFRALLSLPALTQAQLSLLAGLDPAGAQTAQVHAAHSYLSRLGDSALLDTLRKLDIGVEDARRLELMASQITAGLTAERRQALARLVEQALPSTIGSSSRTDLETLATRLEAGDPSRVLEVLDSYFSSQRPAAGARGAESAPLAADSKAIPPLFHPPKRAAPEKSSSAGANEQYDLLSRVKKISGLQNLAHKDAAAALQYAAQILRDPQERRAEVRISAMRVLAQISSLETLPILLELLKDEDWYLRREAARILGGMAARLQGAARESAIGALAQAQQEAGADFKVQSVRLMAAHSLRRFDVEPAAESAAAASDEAKPLPFYRQDFIKEVWPKLKPYAGKALFVLITLWVLGILSLIMGGLLDVIPWSSPSGNPYLLIYFFYTILLPFGVFVLGWIVYGGYHLQKNWGKQPDRGSIPNVHFSDIAGIDDAAVEIQEVMDFLKDPQKYKHLGSRPPKGVLLVGPPGTGKTLLAKALAGDSKASFYEAVGSDFVEMYVGVGASRVRALFNNARDHSPAVIFLDEIDSIGGSRSNSRSRSSEDDKTLTALLSEMDGFDNSKGVIIIAATNRPESLDSALKRPGRFDRMIHVSLPDKLGREAILKLHAAKIRLGVDADFDAIAKRTAGLSGAYLANIINEAATLASRRGADSVEMNDLIEASDRQTVGQKRNFFVSDEQKLQTARHEAGHTLIEILGGGTIDKLTIVPHGDSSLGHARSGSDDDKYAYTRSELEHRLAVLFGGLAAEELTYQQGSTGPGSDLEQATNIARMMVEQLGMGKRSGFEVHDRQGRPAEARPASERTKREVDLDVRELLEQAHRKASQALRSHQAVFEAVVGAVLEKETLTGEEVKEIMATVSR